METKQLLQKINQFKKDYEKQYGGLGLLERHYAEKLKDFLKKIGGGEN